MILAAYEEKEPVDEGALIRRWLEKKHMDTQPASPKEKQKMYSFLMGKGFSSQEIGKALRGGKC